MLNSELFKLGLICNLSLEVPRRAPVIRHRGLRGISVQRRDRPDYSEPLLSLTIDTSRMTEDEIPKPKGGSLTH